MFSAKQELSQDKDGKRVVAVEVLAEVSFCPSTLSFINNAFGNEQNNNIMQYRYTKAYKMDDG